MSVDNIGYIRHHAGMSLREEFLEEVVAYCAAAEMSETAFGLKVVKDGSFVSGLRDGRDVRLGTVERVRAFMADFPTPEPATPMREAI